MTEQGARPRVGIVGYSPFTHMMVDILAPYADVVVSSRRQQSAPGVTFVDVNQALAQDIIIPSIPSQYLEEFFSARANLVNPEALVVDVCSVKVKPIRVLQELLPETCQILATHPLFGPGSIQKNGVSGQTIMLSPTRIEPNRYQQVKQFLIQDLGLKVVETSLEEHDKTMAYVLGLSQYIGRALKQMNIPETELITAAYADLLDMKNVQGNDSWELFSSIMLENPYAMDVNQQFQKAQAELTKKLR